MNIIQRGMTSVKAGYEKVKGALVGTGLAIGVVVTGTMATVQDASAALPAIIGTTLTSVETDATALSDLVWPILVGLTGIVLLMKLFKRFASKM